MDRRAFTAFKSLQRSYAGAENRSEKLDAVWPKSTRRKSLNEFTKCPRKGKGYVINALPRKILAARMMVEMDDRLGRQSPPAVKRLARIDVPLMIEAELEGLVSPQEAPMEVPTDEAANLSPVTIAPVGGRVGVEPADEDHSGHVTLYLPKDLNGWLRSVHDESRLSYPDIVLNAISWAATEDQFGRIFAPQYITVPANDIFGRSPALAKRSEGSRGQSTRPVRFRKEHMKVIVGLARTWAADNRNAFFVGVLSAYREHLKNGVERVKADPAFAVPTEPARAGLISEHEGDSLDETEYLLRSPRNAYRLLASLESARKDSGHER